MTKMTAERRGQIALLLLKDRLRNEGVRLKPDMKREIGNQAAKIGVPVEEAMQFVEELIREMVEEVFPRCS
jgi:hypothetical protein